ncbi:MAG: TatD family hydrolase [Candidatus Bathyarchaeales archaeon]
MSYKDKGNLTSKEVRKIAELKFVDAHIHLTDPEYAGIVNKLLEDAVQFNVVALITNSMNLETSLQNLKLAQTRRGLVYAALGIHPWNVNELAPNELDETIKLILDRAKDEKTVAIGEIGLDPRYLEKATNKSELQGLQHKVFHEMLRVAEKTSLPIIVHSRGATLQVADILPSYNVKQVMLHWFSEPLELLPEIISRGYYITEGPPVAYSKNTQEIIRRIPLANLLTETDGPVRYFGKPFKGKTTTPAFIPNIVDFVAKLKNMKIDDVAHQIYQNSIDFFAPKLNPNNKARIL